MAGPVSGAALTRALFTQVAHACATLGRKGACVVALIALGSLSACARAHESIPMREPVGRPSDGLLHDAGLQGLVDLQERRDGAGLIPALSDGRAVVRARAAFALGSVQAPEAFEPLVAALDDEDAAVRRDAAFALGQLRSAGAVAALTRAFASERDDTVRARILEALDKVPTVSASAALVGLDVPEGLEADRTLAVALLGGERKMLAPAALPLILDHLDDLDPRVRAGAALYFARARDTEPWVGRAARVREALDGYERDDPAAMYLVEGLGRLADPFDANRLRGWAASSPDWRIRANAMAALGMQRGEPEIRDILIDGLSDPSESVAIVAAQSLVKVDSTAEQLQRMETWITGHGDRWRVVEPLLAHVGEAGDSLFVFKWVDALSATDTARARMGVRVLGSVPGAGARERLLRETRSGVAALAAQAVASLARRWPGEPTDDAVRDAYFETFRTVLFEGEEMAGVRAAAYALADSAFVPRGGAVLEEALHHADRGRRIAAARALAQLTGLSADEVEPAPPGGGGAALDAPDSSRAQDPRVVDWVYLAGLGEAPRLVLDTERGRVVIRLDPEEAPLTVQTIARLAQRGSYAGIPFHRVVPNFVVQGGDLTRSPADKEPDFSIRSEFTLVPYWRGVVGMASAGKDTESSQLFITHSMQPHLDGGYTAFGWVVEGMDAVDRLQVGDRILKATVETGS